jgi:chemotaxis protein methyltransferase CheR/type IV pilus assembly protein PilK
MADLKDHHSNPPWALKLALEMDDDQFKQWQRLLESRTGMTLTESRKVFLQTNLSTRMREIGCESYQSYYEKVVSQPQGIIEWMTLVDRLTVQETRFFRDEDACSLLTDYVLTRSTENISKTGLEAWSVGCSTGEEPYTIAMILAQCMDVLGLKHYFGITGTDISKPALEKARLGIYSIRKLGTVNVNIAEKYFNKVNDYKIEVTPSIKERVCFSQVNILDLGTAPMFDMNIIFCQNVLIYFKKWRRKEILNKLVDRLAPGGILILGQGEITGWEHPQVERVPSDKALAFIRRPEKNK